MKRRFPPRNVFAKAVYLTGCDVDRIQQVGRKRPGDITFARAAIVGALRELALPRPSDTEIANYCGYKCRSSVSEAGMRFQCWFPRLRHAWLDMVRDGCEVPASDSESQLTITLPYSLRGDGE